MPDAGLQLCVRVCGALLVTIIIVLISGLGRLLSHTADRNLLRWKRAPLHIRKGFAISQTKIESLLVIYEVYVCCGMVKGSCKVMLLHLNRGHQRDLTPSLLSGTTPLAYYRSALPTMCVCVCVLFGCVFVVFVLVLCVCVLCGYVFVCMCVLFGVCVGMNAIFPPLLCISHRSRSKT